MAADNIKIQLLHYLCKNTTLLLIFSTITTKTGCKENQNWNLRNSLSPVRWSQDTTSGGCELVGPCQVFWNFIAPSWFHDSEWCPAQQTFVRETFESCSREYLSFWNFYIPHKPEPNISIVCEHLRGDVKHLSGSSFVSLHFKICFDCNGPRFTPVVWIANICRTA